MCSLSYKFHEMVFQFLFSIDMGDSSDGETVSLLMRELCVTRKTAYAAYQKACAIFACHEILDQRIALMSQAYALKRIQRVERNILRLAFYELLNELVTSREMVIVEALRLTCKFSTKEASTFVNAILDMEGIDEWRSTLSLPKEKIAQ